METTVAPQGAIPQHANEHLIFNTVVVWVVMTAWMSVVRPRLFWSIYVVLPCTAEYKLQTYLNANKHGCRPSHVHGSHSNSHVMIAVLASFTLSKPQSLYGTSYI